jgi:hypothetical protein
MASKRAVVVGPAFEVQGNTITLKGPAFDRDGLRRFILYWDEVDYPDNAIASFTTSPDLQFLIDANVARRTRVSIGDTPLNVAELYPQTQLAVLLHNNRDEPGCWSLAQTGSDLFVPPEWAPETRTIEVQLYNVLPSPPDGIPLAEILEFKENRRDELIALRLLLDDLYQGVINSADLPHARTAAIDRLEAAVQAVQSVAAEDGPNG